MAPPILKLAEHVPNEIISYAEKLELLDGQLHQIKINEPTADGKYEMQLAPQPDGYLFLLSIRQGEHHIEMSRLFKHQVVTQWGLKSTLDEKNPELTQYIAGDNISFEKCEKMTPEHVNDLVDLLKKAQLIKQLTTPRQWSLFPLTGPLPSIPNEYIPLLSKPN